MTEQQQFNARLLYARNKAERDAVRREWWDKYGTPLVVDMNVDADSAPDANACTCCGIRDVIPEQLIGIVRMREECDQRICDSCSTALAAAASRTFLWLDGLRAREERE